MGKTRIVPKWPSLLISNALSKLDAWFYMLTSLWHPFDVTKITYYPLTHWGREKWPTFANAFPSMKIFEFRFKFSLKFVPKCPINNIPALVRIMAWRRPGDKPLSEPMMARLPTHICVIRPQWVKSKKCMGVINTLGSALWLMVPWCESTRPSTPKILTLYMLHYISLIILISNAYSGG